MANISISIPDAFIAEYNNYKATWDARAFANCELRPLPPPTAPTAQRFIRDLMKGYMRNEVYLRDAEGPNDGSLIAAFEAAVAGV
jgi:hypothetical protein